MLMSSYRLFWQWDGPVDYYLRILQLLEFNNYQQLALEEASDIRPTTGSDNHSQQSQQLNQSDSPILYGSEYLVEECQQIEIPENPMDKEQGVLDYIDYLLRPDHLSSNPGGGAGNDLRWTRSMHLILVERLIDCGYRQLALSMLRRQLGNQTGLRIASLLLDLDDAPYAAIQIAHASKVLNKSSRKSLRFNLLG
ncbi:hypothetical protein BY996DRAFT_309120 [Phakopsora pachyrhizi]|nr:hypothetical protein BY996DRAFT_309120 [Phakopsora pachyrhizi]